MVYYQMLEYIYLPTLPARVSSPRNLKCKTNFSFSLQILRPMSRRPKSHRREATGAPGPTCKTRRINHLWRELSFCSVVFDISTQVLDPFSIEEIQHDSHKSNADSITPGPTALQSLISLPRINVDPAIFLSFFFRFKVATH